MTSVVSGATTVSVDLSKGGDRIEVRFPYNPQDVKRIKGDADMGYEGVPGARFRPPPDGPVWLLPLDMTSARRLREAFGDRLELSPEVKKWGRKENEKAEKLESLASADDAALPNLQAHYPDFYKWLRPYQRAGAAMMSTTSMINADEPGLGKTGQTLAAILECDPHGQHLIVAPKTSLETVWCAGFEQHTDIPYIMMSGEDSHAGRREVLELVEQWVNDDEPFALIVNPAMISFVKDKEAEKIVQGGKLVEPLVSVNPILHTLEWSTIVFDEYHKMGLSNNKTNFFKAANSLKAKHKILLSGTPMGGKPIKLWGALHFLEPHSFTSKWRWVGQWLDVEEQAVGKGAYAKKIHGVREDREEAFDKHLKPYLLRRTKAEVLPELPPKQYEDLWVEMTKTQKKQYEEFAVNAELKIEEENLTATGILAEYMRLKQFAGARQEASRYRDDVKLSPTMDSGKLPHLLEILNNLGIDKGDEEWGDEQLVFFSQFRGMVDMITKWLNEKQGIRAEKITGEVKQSERDSLVKGFQAGEFRVMGVSTTAGGVALTLDKASTGVIMDETWDPDDQTQAEDRIHRASRLDHFVRIIRIRSKGTIEEKIAQMVEGKKMTNDLILDLRRQGLKAI
jgi:SNF2 family DNA or RNA helicase